MRRSACALAFAMFMAGCANFPQFNPGSAPAEAPQRASDAKALEKELSAAKERNALLEAQVAESTGKIERLTGEIRELKMIGSNLGATLERLRRESIMAKSFPAPPPPRRPARTPEPAPGKPAAAPKKPGRASVTPQALYNKSYRAVRDGKNEAAIRGFRLFLRLFPKSQLAPHSQYWLGEAYSARKQYPKALDEFLNLIKRYPGSRKVPDAYYKRGLIYLRRNFPLNATLEFEKLVESFPAHPISKKARVQLQNLRHFTRKKPDDKK